MCQVGMTSDLQFKGVLKADIRGCACVYKSSSCHIRTRSNASIKIDFVNLTQEFRTTKHNAEIRSSSSL